MPDHAPPLPARRLDLRIQPLGDRGSHVVKDPRTGAFFQLGEAECFLLMRLDGAADGRPQRRGAVLQLIGPVPHGFVRQSDAADRRGVVDGQPELDGGVLLGEVPARGELTGQAARQGFAGVAAQVAVLALHLRHQAVGRLALGLGPDGVVQA